MDGQKKKEEEKAKEKELNELFKVAVSQPKVPIGMYLLIIGVFVCFFFWLFIFSGILIGDFENFFRC